ncbi:MAG: undecaprenyl-diphosphate phosphatase [Bacillota bacterium]|nr:undecaprenyl-diphosphate phosphatase [Bacillota bacterium]
MTWVEVIALGIIQGLTEFLPVSSSGHLVLLEKVFQATGNNLLFDIVLHAGTLIAVIAVFYKEIWELIRHPFSKKMGLLLLATVPIVLFSVFAGKFIGSAFEGDYLGFSFILTGIFLLTADAVGKRANRPLKSISWLDSLVMGVMQAVAVLPGVSRSGSAITGGIWRRLDKVAAAKYAFLMSIPAILGAIIKGILDIKDMPQDATGLSVGLMVLGAAFAAVFGFIAIKGMLKLLEKRRFWGFSLYVFVLGGLIIADQFVFHIVFATAPF